MDSTYPYGFPYPECEPPLVKDREDIAHLRDLALAVDAEVERVDDLAVSALIQPEAGWMQRSTNAPFESGDYITFESVFFTNRPPGVFVNLADSSFVVSPGERGVYYVTSSITMGVAGNRPQLQITVNGVVKVAGPHGFPANASTTETSAEMMIRLEEGDAVKFKILHNDPGALTVNYAYGGAVKMVKL